MIPKMVEGCLEVWVTVFLGASSSLPTKALYFFCLPIPKSEELWELCFLYKIPKQGVLQRRESSGQTQGLDLAL